MIIARGPAATQSPSPARRGTFVSHRGCAAALGLIDYLIGDPLHFAMERKMMLLKERAETAGYTATESARETTAGTSAPRGGSGGLQRRTR
jgi:hypothetical protein